MKIWLTGLNHNNYMAFKITNIVRDLRMKQSLTQTQLAKKLKVTRQTILMIEKGNYDPALSLAMRVSVFFKKPIEKIFFK